MSKRKSLRKNKKSDKNQNSNPIEKIVLITALLNLIKAVLDLIKDFT